MVQMFGGFFGQQLECLSIELCNWKKEKILQNIGFGIVFFMFIGSIHIHKGNLINDIILNLN